MMPRRQIYPEDCVPEVCGSSSVLIVEEDANALDPLLWNCSGAMYFPQAVSPHLVSQQLAVSDDFINEGTHNYNL